MAGLSPGEAGRKAAHMAFGGLAFLLRFTTWPEAAALAAAAVLFNWQALPRLGGRRLWRAVELERGHAAGVLLYPVSVLGLILVFRHELWQAAAIWGVLAWGDGMAAVVGQSADGPRLPWNPRKSWAGSLAFVICGSVGASLLSAWTLGLPLADWSSARILEIIVPVVLACALVESLPARIDDNVSVALVGGLVLALLVGAGPRGLLDPAGRVSDAVLLNAVLAGLALAVGTINVSGAISAAAIGAAVTWALGLPGLAVLLAFFIPSSVATRLGHAAKAAAGIAEAAARGWRNVWANGGVAAMLALAAGHASSGARAPLIVAFAAALAAAAADTCSSEVGKAYGRRAWRSTTLAPARAGTRGAVSLEGTLAGLAAAGFVAAAGASVGLYAGEALLVVALSGVLGSLAESLVGDATSGRDGPSNHLLNAFNTALGAAAAWLGARLAS